MKFKIGDRVIAISAPDFNDELIGRHGIVEDIVRGSDRSLYVLFDLGGRKFHWWCEEESLSLTDIVGPPIPVGILVERKGRKLWNRSNFVSSNSKLAY